jgi:hypothetical protein
MLGPRRRGTGWNYRRYSFFFLPVNNRKSAGGGSLVRRRWATSARNFCATFHEQRTTPCIADRHWGLLFRLLLPLALLVAITVCSRALQQHIADARCVRSRSKLERRGVAQTGVYSLLSWPLLVLALCARRYRSRGWGAWQFS